MALRIITGVPGSGKSFYAVNHLASKYCKIVGGTYELKPDYKIITNIDTLMLDTVDLESAVEKTGGIEKFFTFSIQETVAKKYKIEKKQLIYVIDEAQQFFHRRFYNRDVFGFFETHRHLGLDIYLITQNLNLLPKDLVALAELEIRAIPRTLSIGGFNYLRKTNKEVIGRKYLKRNKKIFALYKSQIASETEKIRSPYLKYIIPVIILFGFGFYGLKNSFFGRAVGLSESHATTSGQHVPVVSSVKNSDNQIRQSIELVPFVPVSYSRNGSHLSIYNPLTNDLCPVSLFPYELKAVASGCAIRLYARIPFTEKTEN